MGILRNALTQGIRDKKGSRILTYVQGGQKHIRPKTSY